ncbi:MAG TPA: SIMPL domain-containing protein [Streptosporangiaceae bacterium]|jgi:hypothetical protein
MHTGPLLAVRGEATHEVEPEVARIEVSVAARAPSRAAVRTSLADRSADIDRILGDFAEIVEKSESSGIRLNPQLATRSAGAAGPPRMAGQPESALGTGLPGRLGPGQPAQSAQPPGYRGVVHYSITVTGFHRLGDLMARLASLELTEVGGPWWELRPASPAQREARIAAVTDAVSRARDYAAAVGSRLAGLLELADAHLLSDAAASEPRPLSPSPRLPHRPRAIAVEEPVFDLAPVRQVVRATVEARFTMTEPDLTTVPGG